MEILLLLVLILLNGVFVMSEMALVSARKSRLRQWSDEGRAGADTAWLLRTHPRISFPRRRSQSRSSRS